MVSLPIISAAGCKNTFLYFIAGIIDSSGIRFYISEDLRPMDAGIIELGLEYTDKMAIPPGQNSFLLSGYCVSECTAVVSDYFLEVGPSGIAILFTLRLEQKLI